MLNAALLYSMTFFQFPLLRCFFYFVFYLSRSVHASPLDTAQTNPLMGYHSYPDLDCSVSTSLILSRARFLVDSGMRSRGYDLLLLGDCWQADSRSSEGNLEPDSVRFPDGISALADHLHRLSLRLGLGVSDLPRTSAGKPGSPPEFAELDAATFKAWGVDVVRRGDSLDVSDRFSFLEALRALKMDGELRHKMGPLLSSAQSPVAAAREKRSELMSLQPTHLSRTLSRSQFNFYCVLGAPLLLAAPLGLTKIATEAVGGGRR